jgi:hypothetical protein
VQLGIIRCRDRGAFQSQLLSDGAVPVNPSASKEAVTRHALDEQKKDE